MYEGRRSSYAKYHSRCRSGTNVAHLPGRSASGQRRPVTVLTAKFVETQLALLQTNLIGPARSLTAAGCLSIQTAIRQG